MDEREVMGAAATSGAALVVLGVLLNSTSVLEVSALGVGLGAIYNQLNIKLHFAIARRFLSGSSSTILFLPIYVAKLPLLLLGLYLALEQSETLLLSCAIGLASVPLGGAVLAIRGLCHASTPVIIRTSTELSDPAV